MPPTSHNETSAPFARGLLLGPLNGRGVSIAGTKACRGSSRRFWEGKARDQRKGREGAFRRG
jgi:hypothetical protein